MDKEELKGLHERNTRRQPDYRVNQAYFYGRNPWLESREPRREPDNRIAVPFAKMAVEDMAGYAGMPEYRESHVDNVRTDESAQTDAQTDRYIQEVREVENFNEAGRVKSELYQASLVHGVAYELFWYTAEQGVEFAKVKQSEMELSYDDGVKPKLLGAVRFWNRDNGTANAATVYDAERSIDYVRRGSTWQQTAEAVHPYNRVPVAKYAINAQEHPLFEAEKGLIDAQDKLLSSSVNEVDRFNALIALFPYQVDQAFVDKLRQMNVIDDLGQWERWPEYLEKNLDKISSFYQQLADRMERLFHKSIKVPDFADENFAGNDSGIALAYKLLGLEFKAAQIDTYFDRGVRERYELIGAGLNAGATRWPVEDYEVVITNRRNLPVDEAMKVQIAQQLLGIVSKETVLRMLPRSIVEDVEREMERMESEPSLTLGGMEEDDDADDSE